MKLLFALFISCLCVGCASYHPTCKLPAGVLPRANCHQALEPFWSSRDGTRFPYSKWLPQARRPKAIVILVPGWDGVTGDYESLALALQGHGYAVYGSELRAQIYDPKISRRGNPDAWQDWVTDLQAFTQFVQKQHPGIPVFYHGHSFGGVIAIEAAAEAQGAGKPKGLIVHSPGYPLLIKKESFWRGLLFQAVSWYRLDVRQRIGEKKLTDSPQLNCQWIRSEDRLTTGYKIEFLIQAGKLGHQARLNAATLTLPTLALEGGKDDISVDPETERSSYDAFLRRELSGGHAEVLTFEQGCHLLTEGGTKRQAIDGIIRWLDGQL